MTGPAAPVGVLLSYGAYLPRGPDEGHNLGGRPGSCVSFVSIVGGVRGVGGGKG
jgi:hypothetical protein